VPSELEDILDLRGQRERGRCPEQHEQGGYSDESMTRSWRLPEQSRDSLGHGTRYRAQGGYGAARGPEQGGMRQRSGDDAAIADS
jgi:hypothetical protein